MFPEGQRTVCPVTFEATVVPAVIPGQSVEPAGSGAASISQLPAVEFTTKSVPVPWVGNVTSTSPYIAEVVDGVAQTVPPVVVNALWRSSRKKACVNCG